MKEWEDKNSWEDFLKVVKVILKMMKQIWTLKYYNLKIQIILVINNKRI